MLDQDDPSALAYEEDVRADALPAGAVQAPRPARGADLRAWRYATQQKHPVLWGPVPAAEAARIAGAPAGCESVLIAPAIPSDLLCDVENLIPASVKPWPTDTLPWAWMVRDPWQMFMSSVADSLANVAT